MRLYTCGGIFHDLYTFFAVAEHSGSNVDSFHMLLRPWGSFFDVYFTDVEQPGNSSMHFLQSRSIQDINFDAFFFDRRALGVSTSMHFFANVASRVSASMLSLGTQSIRGINFDACVAFRVSTSILFVRPRSIRVINLNIYFVIVQNPGYQF